MKTLNVIIDSHLRISKIQLKKTGISIVKLRDMFEYANPDYHKKKAMGYYTGDTPRKITLSDTTDDEILLPRGGYHRLKKFMQRHGIELKIIDKMIKGTGPLGMIYVEPIEWQLNKDQLWAARMALNFTQGLLVGPCGCGKTEILLQFISNCKEKTIVIVHTERLLKQWQEKAAERFFVDKKEIGLLYGKVKREKNLTIGLVRTVLNLMKKDNDFVNHWGCIISDESHHCFTYQTLIGDKQIKDIKVGDLVPSFDPNTGIFTKQKVKNVFKHKTNKLLRIVIDSEEFFCTPDHPFAVSGGFVKVRYLRVGSKILNFKGESNEHLQMREPCSRERNRKALPEMPFGKKREKKSNSFLYLRRMWKNISENWKEIRSKRTFNMFKRMSKNISLKNIFGDNAKNESKKIFNTFRKNEEKQSNVLYKYSSKSKRNSSKDRSQANNSRWKWPWSDRTTVFISQCFELGNGSSNKNKNGSWEWLSAMLQNRYSKQRIDDCDRSGWAYSSIIKSSRNGQEERRIPGWSRVESIEVLEQRSDGGFGSCCPEGFVYNLKVEKTETYLIGKNNIAVHNCSAATFSELLNNFPARYRIGATATHKRKDAKEVLVYDCFGSISVQKGSKSSIKPKILFEITDEDLDRYGRIIPVDVILIATEFEFDLNNENRMQKAGFEKNPNKSPVANFKLFCKKTGYKGPRNTYSDMLDEMGYDKTRQGRILQYLLPEIHNSNPCLLLADRRDICLEMQAWLKRRKIDCGRLMGGKNNKEQDKTILSISNGDLNCAVGTTVADEGLDIPRLSRGFGCTPTGSNKGRLTQQLGRFKRKHKGKTDAKYFYFWDGRVKGLRYQIREIFRAIKPPHKLFYSESPNKIVPMTNKLLKLIEKKYNV